MGRHEPEKSKQGDQNEQLDLNDTNQRGLSEKPSCSALMKRNWCGHILEALMAIQLGFFDLPDPACRRATPRDAG